MKRYPALFPALAILNGALTFAQTPVLVLLNGPAGANTANHELVAAHMKALGASDIARYSVINALGGKLPPLTADRLASDPKISEILSYDDLSSRSFAELLRQIDRAAQAPAGGVVSASVLDGDSQSAGHSLLLDRLIDDHQVTVVLKGGMGSQANAITAGLAAIPGTRKPDFIGPDAGHPIEDALNRLTQMGVTSALARKAILINTASSASGWSETGGWGAVNRDAIDALNTGGPICVQQTQQASSCFAGAITATEDYETKSSSPVKITVAWSRGQAARNLEIHVYDHAHKELAAATTDDGNVQQITAQNDTGLLIRVKLTQPIAAGDAPLPFALVSSVPLTTAPHTCGASNSISPSTMNFPASGGTQSVTISVDPGCNWQLTGVLTGMDVFAIPQQTSGTGPATVSVVAGPNPYNVQQTERIVLQPDGFNGPYMGVTQDAGVRCVYTAAATGTLPIGVTGGSAGLTITASPATCTSSASSNVTWLAVSSPSGTGNWSPILAATPNVALNASTSARSATVDVSGTTPGQAPVFMQNIAIAQAGVQCTFSLPTTQFTIPYAGIPQSSPQSFSVMVTDAACQWTATTAATFVHLVNNNVQTGKLTYTVQYYADAATASTQSLPAFILCGGDPYGGSYTVPVQTFSADGTVTPPPPPLPQGGFDMTKVIVTLDTYPASTGKINTNVDPKTGKWHVDGLVAGKNYQAIVTIPLPNLYDTLPLSIDDVTANSATNLNFRILLKGHGLYIGQTQITVGSTFYSRIIALLTKIDPNLGAYAKLILDALIDSAYRQTAASYQDLLKMVAFRALLIRAARDLGKQVDIFDGNANFTCKQSSALCKD